MSIKEKLINWYDNDSDRIFIISGYAGCGKTYTAKSIPKLLGLKHVAFLAPTGKAALVLENGASTIHSYMYEVVEEPDGTMKFIKKMAFQFVEELLIVDEISMVNEELLNDLRSLGIPLIGLGDPAQLPPVEGKSDILDNPDVFLTKVYRNETGILELSVDVRKGRPIKSSYEDVKFGRYLNEDMHLYNDEDTIIICKFNKTRQQINSLIRKNFKQFDDILHVGEKLMNLRNNHNTGLMNGSILTVNSISQINKYSNIAIVNVSNGKFSQTIKIDLDIITGIETKPKRYLKEIDIHEVDYAYAITCHKAQGSEFNKVMVINEGQYFDDHNKWLYTAVTRARKKLYIYN
jgi:exodeoxyribonuclease V